MAEAADIGECPDFPNEQLPWLLDFHLHVNSLPDALGPANLEEILRVAAASEPYLTRLVRRVVERVG